MKKDNVRVKRLWRLVQLRHLNAPTGIIRHEQLLLWALRRNPEIAPVQIPNWKQNYQKFVQIHFPAGEA